METFAFPQFLKSLFAAGRVTVAEFRELPAAERAAGEKVLLEQDILNRLDLPGTAPAFDPAAAMWAATHFYAACQLAVFRDLGEEKVAELQKSTLKDSRSASAHYSVDITFRFLRDLLRLAQAASSEDPLVKLLLHWAHEWPLSSVGIGGLADLDVRPITGSTSLLTFYVDRIISRGDKSRLASQPVAIAARSALGLYPKLAPQLAISTTDSN